MNERIHSHHTARRPRNAEDCKDCSRVGKEGRLRSLKLRALSSLGISPTQSRSAGRRGSTTSTANRLAIAVRRMRSTISGTVAKGWLAIRRLFGSGGTIIVVSDLHVGAGILDDFNLDEAFERFVESIAGRGRPVELVINGDFLEFVQADPWHEPDLEAESSQGVPLCHTEDLSLRKLENIIAAHPRVFSALAGFLRSNPKNTITVMPGNHDADIYWPAIRRRLTEVVLGSSASTDARLSFFLEAVYHPASAPSVWIEHGHRYDPCNNFEVDGSPCWSVQDPPIRVDQNGRNRIVECIGTRFLIRYLNALDASYPFVDNVKPFGRFWSLFALSLVRPGYGPLKAAVAIHAMARYLASTLRTNPADLLSSDAGDENSIRLLVARAYESSSATRKARIEAGIEALGLSDGRPLSMRVADPTSANETLEMLARYPEILDGFHSDAEGLLGSGGPEGTLALASAYRTDESAELIDVAEHALRMSGASIVVMGHTHDLQDHPRGLNYVNTGCWTRYLNANVKGPTPWSILRGDAAEQFPFILAYAELDPLDPQTVTLRTWLRSDG